MQPIDPFFVISMKKNLHNYLYMTQTNRLTLLLLCLIGVFSTSLTAQNLNIQFRSKMNFPGQTMANICGYAADGKEYAICGGSTGIEIVDVTNPDALVKIVKIPGPTSLWKEIKTYKHYAYITTEGGGGLQIVDMSTLPVATYHSYTGDGAILNQLSSIHSLHIDTTKGFLYAHGTSLFGGGSVVFDLNNDPWNPTYAGKYDANGYVHDGWVDNDTLYAAHISGGFFSIVNMANKVNPQVLATQPTPNFFTHNTWMSVDRKTIFTTDETDDSFLAAYDISDPDDVKFLDKVQSNPGSNSVGHNTHIIGNYAVTSWYHDGVTIVDVSDPTNMVQVGNYDNDPTVAGGGQQGCWGVYPYLPSGNLIATYFSNDQTPKGELWVLTPTYKQAAYLQGSVKSASTGNPINNAKIEIVSGDPGTIEFSLANGGFSFGQATAGSFEVKVSKVGYVTQTQTVTLVSGETLNLNFQLVDEQVISLTGTVVSAVTNLPIPFAHIGVVGISNFNTIADANGQFTLPGIYIGTYQVIAGAWGYGYKTFNNQTLNTNQTFNFVLPKGYRDDFVFDYGWEKSGTSENGDWEIAEPIGINPGGGFLLVPETDLSADIGNTCYVTGNSAVIGENDVEGGTQILRSPVMDLTSYNQPELKGFLFFTSITFTQLSLDSIRIYVENGTEEALLYDLPGTTFNWRPLNKNIKSVIPITNTMRIRIECFDDPIYTDQDSYEASFDYFRITDAAPSATNDPLSAAQLMVHPNPFKGQAVVAYEAPAGDTYRLQITDMLGRIVETVDLQGNSGMEAVGQALHPGIYFARLEQSGRVGKTVKLVKAE